jgi:hypothetical protein
MHTGPGHGQGHWPPGKDQRSPPQQASPTAFHQMEPPVPVSGSVNLRDCLEAPVAGRIDHADGQHAETYGPTHSYTRLQRPPFGMTERCQPADHPGMCAAAAGVPHSVRRADRRLCGAPRSCSAVAQRGPAAGGCVGCPPPRTARVPFGIGPGHSGEHVCDCVGFHRRAGPLCPAISPGGRQRASRPRLA